jgi:hypothetical protein
MLRAVERECYSPTAPNKALEPTAYSVRSAPAFGGGSPPAFGAKGAEKKQQNMQKGMCTLFLFSQ